MGMGVGMGMCMGMVVCIGNSMGQGTLVWGSHGIEKAHVNVMVKANACQFL